MIGTRHYYDEGGDRFLVTVVADSSDVEREAYRIRVDRVLTRDAGHARRFQVGDEFEVWRTRDQRYRAYVSWDMEPYVPEGQG